MHPSKALIVAAVALVITCLAAPDANASWIASEHYSSALSSSQLEEVTLGTEGGTVKCSKTTFTGTLSDISHTVSLTPSFSECTAFGGSATVTPNGCTYVIHPGEETASREFNGTLDVSCGEGKAIVVATSLCEAKITAQSGLSSLKLSDETTSPERMSVKFEVSSAKYEVTKDSGTCPFKEVGKKTDGTMGGKEAILATHGVESVGMFALSEATIACETGGEEVCQKQLSLPFKFKLTAATSSFALGPITIACETSNLELEAVGQRFNKDMVLIGLEWDFLAKKCEAGKVPCTVASAAPNFLTYSHPLVNGAGDWLVEAMQLNLTCGTAVKCRYKKAKQAISIVPTKGAVKGQFEAKGTELEQDPITGEVGCTNPAKLTGTFVLGDIAFFKEK
jgi:hypothetical protein